MAEHLDGEEENLNWMALHAGQCTGLRPKAQKPKNRAQGEIY